jgi:hypothetical protein
MLLDDAEIIRRLRTIKQSPQFDRLTRQAPTINGIARLSGVARRQIYQIIDGQGRLGPKSRARLSKVLTCGYVCGARSSVLCPPEPASAPISLNFKRFLPENTR